MSKFSAYLKYLIKENGESISSIARNIGAERTSIHRALKDERILPYKVVYALAGYLQLPLEERREFFRLYEMLIQGEDVWLNRTSVSELLTQLSTIRFDPEMPVGRTADISPAAVFDNGLIEGEYSVQNTLYTLLFQEAGTGENVRFQVFLPFGADLSMTFVRLLHSGVHFSIDQLFCFPSAINDACTQSVRILQQIVPLCLIARDAYHPYYFYEHPGALSVNPLNYYIITPHYLILLSENQSTALIHRSAHLVKFYSEHFTSLMEHCESLVSCSTTLAGILETSTAMIDRKSALYLMNQPCFGRYYTPEIIEKYFRGDSRFGTEMYHAVTEHFSIVRDIENFGTVFSETGLRYFTETGILTELPSEYVSVIEPADRKRFLSQLREDIAADRVNGRIARPSLLRIPDYLTLYIDTNGNAWFDTTSDFIHGAFYCDIHISEKSICHAFRDFFMSFSGSQMVYTKEDTLYILDGEIRRLERDGWGLTDVGTESLSLP